MLGFIREAGWPIFLVLALGTASLGVAIRYALDGQRELWVVIVGLGVATLLVGAFGTALGIQASARYIGDVLPERRWIFVLGVQESLHNLTAALAFAIVDALLLTRGAWRSAQHLFRPAAVPTA